MTRRQYLLFMCGQLGMMLLARFFFQWIVIFSTQTSAGGQVLFSAAMVGVSLLVFRVLDGVGDPLAGAFSDVWVKKGKERRTLLLFWFALPAIGLVLCFFPSFALGGGLRWLMLLSGMFLFFLGYTFYAIPYWSLVGDYSQGLEHIRRNLSNLLGLGLMLATAVGFIITPFVVEQLGFTWASVVFGVIGTLLMVLPYYAQPEMFKAGNAELESTFSFRVLIDGVVDALKHKEFFAILMVFGGSQMSLTVMTAAAPFIAVDLLGGTKADVARLMGPLMLLSIPTFIIVPKLSKRFGWQKVTVSAAILLGCVYGLCGFVGVSIISSPMVTAMIIFGLAGPMVATLLGVEGEAITACAEKSGDNKVSMYFGVYNFMVKILNGVAIFLTGALADLAGSSTGTGPVRAMPLVAGGSLVLGVVIYFLLKRGANLTASTA